MNDSIRNIKQGNKIQFSPEIKRLKKADRKMKMDLLLLLPNNITPIDGLCTIIDSLNLLEMFSSVSKFSSRNV